MKVSTPTRKTRKFYSEHSSRSGSFASPPSSPDIISSPKRPTRTLIVMPTSKAHHHHHHNHNNTGKWGIGWVTITGLLLCMSAIYLSTLQSCMLIANQALEKDLQQLQPNPPRSLHQQTQMTQTIKNRERQADAYFNGFPLIRVSEPPSSQVHCVGENFNSTSSWLFRSCDFQTYCFNVKTKKFAIYLDEQPLNFTDLDYYERAFSSTNPTKAALGTWAGSQSKSWMQPTAYDKFGISKKLGHFRPRIFIKKKPSMYYYMPDTTIVNFLRHSKSSRNPGHLIWDDFMGIYTLLDIFDRLDDQLFLSELERTIYPEDEELRVPFEKDMIRKFIPLMGEHNYTLRTYESFETEPPVLKWSRKKEARVICASHGLVGSGMFSDHGHDHWHGQKWTDYDRPHNIGRGGFFRRYRAYMMRNMGINPDTQIHRPYQMIVSQNSTTKWPRVGVMFEEQMNAIRERYGSKRIRIVPVILHTFSLREQLEMAAQSAFFLSTVGGGAVTAFFLPKGASLLLYPDYSKLDWDLFNNFPDLMTHWLPRVNRRGKQRAMRYLVDLVGRELTRLDRRSPSFSFAAKDDLVSAS